MTNQPGIHQTHNETMNEPRTANRRTVLEILGGGIVAGAFATTSVAATDTLSHQLNSVRSATKKYRTDVQQARDDGYDDHISPYVPGMGFHFENESLFAEDENEGVSLTEPAVLVYQTTGNYDPAPMEPHDPARDDDLRLGAAEFIHEGTPGADGDYFDDENAQRNLKVSEAEGWTQVPGTDHTGLHTWVHRGNPDGVFAPFNPTVD